MLVLMKRYGIISLALLVLLLSTFSAAAAPIYEQNDPNTDRPTLVVQKYVSDDEILVGESLTVYVNITNFGNMSAYNITIQEPTFQRDIIDTERDYETYKWVRLGQGAVVNYSYVLTPQNDGPYTLEPTQITYLDENGTRYTAKSSHISFEVSEEQPEEETDELWNNILIMSSIFAAIPIVVYYVHEIFVKR